MKALLMLYLIMLGSPALASQCKALCRAEKRSCIKDTYARAAEAKKDASSVVAASVDEMIETSIRVCKSVLNECYDDCKHPKPKRNITEGEIHSILHAPWMGSGFPF